MKETLISKNGKYRLDVSCEDVQSRVFYQNNLDSIAGALERGEALTDFEKSIGVEPIK